MIDEREFHRQEKELRALFHRLIQAPASADPDRVDRILQRVRREGANKESLILSRQESDEPRGLSATSEPSPDLSGKR